jgi:succinate dehydrogenase / fumarate reductase cytochrome b subunit
MRDNTRPLSPHLQVYRPQITSILSILHRMTGVTLALAAILLTYWLASAAYGPEAFGRAQALLESWFGRLVLFGFTFSLFYHMCNGIRHLGWDMLWGFEMPRLRITGAIVVITSLSLTVLSWLMAYGHVGKL